MKVLVAYEFSGRVRQSFVERGHDAYSCDLLPSEISGQHLQCDVHSLDMTQWDLVIAHPPCTYLSNAGIRWFNEERYGDKARERKRLRLEGMEFVLKIANSKCSKIAIENPRGWLNSHWRKPDQTVQPWMFGDEFNKPTCLWLKGLPKLTPTNIVSKGVMVTHVTKKGETHTDSKWYYDAIKLPPTERQRFRSKTFQGIANAMAEQWG